MAATKINKDHEWITGKIILKQKIFGCKFQWMN